MSKTRALEAHEKDGATAGSQNRIWRPLVPTTNRAANRLRQGERFACSALHGEVAQQRAHELFEDDLSDED